MCHEKALHLKLYQRCKCTKDYEKIWDLGQPARETFLRWKEEKEFFCIFSTSVAFWVYHSSQERFSGTYIGECLRMKTRSIGGQMNTIQSTVMSKTKTLQLALLRKIVKTLWSVQLDLKCLIESAFDLPWKFFVPVWNETQTSCSVPFVSE